MKRGELFLVKHPSGDAKRQRVFVVVSRQVLIDSQFSSVVCAPVYTSHDGLATQVAVDADEGLKHDSSIHCDALVSIPKANLTNSLGALPPHRTRELDQALRIAPDIPD